MSVDAERPSPNSLRLLAAAVDYTVVMVIVVVVAAISESADVTSVGNWVALAAAAAYPIVTIAQADRTLGKRLCNLVVRRTDGGRVGWARSAVRFVASIAPLVLGTVIAGAIGNGRTLIGELIQVLAGASAYAPILFDPQRRGLHDLAAGTRVVCVAPSLTTITDALVDRARRQAGGN